MGRHISSARCAGSVAHESTPTTTTFTAHTGPSSPAPAYTKKLPSDPTSDLDKTRHRRTPSSRRPAWCPLCKALKEDTTNEVLAKITTFERSEGAATSSTPSSPSRLWIRHGRQREAGCARAPSPDGVLSAGESWTPHCEGRVRKSMIVFDGFPRQLSQIPLPQTRLFRRVSCHKERDLYGVRVERVRRCSLDVRGEPGAAVER